MRHINALSAEKVPRDDEFKFRARAKALVDKWHDILSASKAAEGAVRKPATNGKPHAEDSGAANGKEEATDKEESAAAAAEEKEKDETKESMEVDSKEEAAPAPATEEDNNASAEEPAALSAVESTADVTMSEA